MSNDLDVVIAKVKALLALSNGNPNVNESVAAALAANKIMQAHRLSLAEVEASGQKASEDFITIGVYHGGRRSNWRELLLWTLCTNYGGAWYIIPVNRNAGVEQGALCIVAKESDAKIIEYMFAHLSREVERLCDVHCHKKGRAAAASWKVGCAEGISQQFSAMREQEKREEANSTSAAIVLLSNRGKEANDYLTNVVLGNKGGKAKGLTGGRDYDARMNGRAVGRSMSLGTKGLTQ